MIFDIIWVSAVFLVLYVGFIGLFFWGLKGFKKILDREASEKERKESSVQLDHEQKDES